MRKIKVEVPDELGFTFSDYYYMQCLAESKGYLNDTLLSGWDITLEQIELINNPRSVLHRVAVISFYYVNFPKLKRLAKSFFCSYYNKAYISSVSSEDLLQQLFLDLLAGYLKLPSDTSKIVKSICRCFRYTAVGGLEGVENVEDI